MMAIIGSITIHYKIQHNIIKICKIHNEIEDKKELIDIMEKAIQHIKYIATEEDIEKLTRYNLDKNGKMY